MKKFYPDIKTDLFYGNGNQYSYGNRKGDGEGSGYSIFSRAFGNHSIDGDGDPEVNTCYPFNLVQYWI